ncbi:MAG: ribosome biogenesis GTPase Der [Candidatus Magasanikbacteria bacterium]|uniref:GTPase Der n=1 Tax=Candidatus Magasanikbacteria bacterium CG10_big_fil_rev_8_21_14_0_10_38_6 TaxID=1974647 RepID=A0A2M6P0B8_9BACT|nr:ribosome biogenesis GTPase Der [Candidatus Magasanikbacteria bacterium]NCS71869.1 ribosome biogenesis GTPase Der [Candidatus Magasanikbacteria bacterium]PIR76999.1 MAG: ribosome biogenesis GTPase Der [Candidatus Magasanikbacteria bacterium CG10_big_fil_rev_8_21_14_0_10_38_6]
MANPAAQQLDNLPVIVLVGRVNVGKSTLFNKLIEQSKALVSDIPGTTRTPNEGVVLWRGKHAKVIDTGGLTFTDEIPLEQAILRQSEIAMKQADVILFVTDAKTGILPQEKELAKRLRRINLKPVLVVANKADNNDIRNNFQSYEWLKLGLGEAFPISAASGFNVGDLLDEVYRLLHSTSTRPKKNIIEPKDHIRISLIGKPNVGKSSLFNKLIGEEKVIVSDLAHTTREPYDTLMVYPYTTPEGKTLQQHITFVDTAGIRRKSKVDRGLENEGIHKSIKSIEDSDIVLFVIDGSQPISSQDRQLGGLLEKRGTSVIILINKWDLSEDKEEEHQKKAMEMVKSHFPHLKFAPVLLVSGKTGYRTHNIFPEIMTVWKARHTQVPIKQLEYFLLQATRTHKPSRGKGTRQPKVMGIRQIATAPPVFEVFIKYRTSIHRSYINFLENKLREEFDFIGSPIIIKLRKTKR